MILDHSPRDPGALPVWGSPIFIWGVRVTMYLMISKVSTTPIGIHEGGKMQQRLWACGALWQ